MEQRLRRYQSSSPPLCRGRGHGVAAAPLGMFGSASANRRAEAKAARNKAGDEHIIRLAQADRRRPSRMSDTLKPAPPRVRRSFCCTAGPTTFIALSMSPFAGVGGLSGDRPYLRGYGRRAFCRRHDAQWPAIGDRLDAIALMDALKIDKATLAGFDWGARTAECRRALAGALQGDGLGQRLSDRQPGIRQDAVAA